MGVRPIHPTVRPTAIAHGSAATAIIPMSTPTLILTVTAITITATATIHRVAASVRPAVSDPVARVAADIPGVVLHVEVAGTVDGDRHVSLNKINQVV